MRPKKLLPMLFPRKRRKRMPPVYWVPEDADFFPVLYGFFNVNVDIYGDL